MKFKFTLFVVAVLSTMTVRAQYSIGGGLSTLHGAGVDVNRMGLHAFYEEPVSNSRTKFYRATIMFPSKNTRQGSIEAVDFSVSPQKIKVDEISKTNLISLDGGNRVYFINDYDIGFALYGALHLKGILMIKSSDYSNFPSGVSKSDYKIPQSRSLFSLLASFGANFGAKYQIPGRGAITADIAGDLITPMIDQGQVMNNEISALSITLNFAYRFDFY